MNVYFSAKGDGLLNIRAISGILQSRTFVLIDAFFFDSCENNSKSSSWIVYNQTVSIPTFDNGMFAERTTTGNGYLFITNTNYDLPFAIELDVVEVTGTVRFTLNTGDWVNVDLSSNDKIKIEYYSDKQVVTKNGTATTYNKTNTSSCRPRLQFSGVSNIKLKNMVIYSL